MKISAIAVSDRGQALAEQLRAQANSAISVSRFEREQLPLLASQKRADDILFLFCPVTDAVRVAAEFYNYGNIPTAIIQIDEQGKYVVPIAPSGNSSLSALVREVAATLSAIPILSEPEQVESFSIDKWAAAAGLRIATPELINSVKEKLLSGESVCYSSIFPIAGALPPGIREAESWEKCDFSVSFLTGFDRQTLLLVPPVLSLGIDGSTDGLSTSLEDLVLAFMNDCGFHPLALDVICCTADSPLKDAAQALSEKLNIRFLPVERKALEVGEVRFTQTRYPYFPENECEKCAVLGLNSALLLRRTEHSGVGFAVAVLEPQES